MAHIAARNDLPVLVIRALSDNADTDYVEFKEFDISEYADTAAKIAVNIVKCMKAQHGPSRASIAGRAVSYFGIANLMKVNCRETSDGVRESRTGIAFGNRYC